MSRFAQRRLISSRCMEKTRTPFKANSENSNEVLEVGTSRVSRKSSGLVITVGNLSGLVQGSEEFREPF